MFDDYSNTWPHSMGLSECSCSSVYDEMISQLEFATPSYIPERGLLAGILERAVRDLADNAHHLDRKSAINWFTASPFESPNCHITFIDCITYLELGNVELSILHEKVQSAIRYENRQKPKEE